MGSAGPASGERLYHLDGIRGVAALVVALFYHYGHFFQPIHPGASAQLAPFYAQLRPLYDHAWFAVDIFFVLSGFVFAHVHRGRSPTGRAFFLRRFARLYPSHLASLVLMLALGAAFLALRGHAAIGQDDTSWRFLLNLLSLQYGIVDLVQSFNTPAWSLSIEAAMYVLFFLSFRSPRATPIFFAFAVAGIILIQSNARLPVLNLDVGRGLLGFFAGALACRLGRWAWVVPGLCLAAGLAFARNVFLAQAAFLAGMILLRDIPALRAPLSLRPLRWLGDRSLTIYLFHTPLQVAILLILPGSGWYAHPAFMAAYLVLLLAASDLIYRHFEDPMRRAINAWAARPDLAAPPDGLVPARPLA